MRISVALLLVAGCVAGLLAASPAASQPAVPPIDFDPVMVQIMVPGQRVHRLGELAPATFAVLDLDRDGDISTKDRERNRRIYGATLRAGSVTQFLHADFDGDGVVNREELERYQKITVAQVGGVGIGLDAGGQRQQLSERMIDAMKRADRNGDGRIDWQEMVAAGRQVQIPGPVGMDAFYQVVMAFDANRDGKVTMDEYIDGLEKRFAEFDTDGDGVLSRAEFEAYWRQTGRPAPRVSEIQESHQDKLIAECKLPRASKDAKVVVFNAYRIEGVSSAAVGPQDEVTKAARVIIERGSEPLYIILIGWERVIWQFEGQVGRVQQMVLASAASNVEPRTAAVGATGLPKEIVTFSGVSRCGAFWVNMNTKYPEQTKHSLRALIGRSDVTVVDRENVWNLRLPSGAISRPTEAELRNTLLVAGPDLARVADVRSKFIGYNPGGIVRIDPATVISQQPVTSYDVLPEQAGLVQLLLDGTLTRDAKGRFLIHKAMRFPTGLAGAHSEQFVLLKDVPMPTGSPGHSGVVSEETGQQLCPNGKCSPQQ
jgi:Ca2+-binding EF-hand superfamily protein